MDPAFLIYVVYVERQTDPVPLFSSDVKFFGRRSPAAGALALQPELRLPVIELRLLFIDPFLPVLDVRFFVIECSLLLAVWGFVSDCPDARAGY